eukprot:TRINITY_DN37996_c0_g1_i1.p1 TRINITY_DN37996_c0_g1~~TRINITY_DN37996_c0_g1_i1.p1  ORF type:complete len:269 (+),score=48.85 TRINITY_DN37996_c0_g1_i1:75-881(+)
MAAAAGLLGVLSPGSAQRDQPLDPRQVTGYDSELYVWNPERQVADHAFTVNGFVIEEKLRQVFLPQQGQVVRYISPGGDCHRGGICFVNTEIVNAEFPPSDRRRTCTVVYFGPGDLPVNCVVRLPPQVDDHARKLQGKIKELNQRVAAGSSRDFEQIDTVLQHVMTMLEDCDKDIARVCPTRDPLHQQEYPTKPLLYSMVGLRRQVPHLVVPMYGLLDLFKDDLRKQDVIRQSLGQIALGDPKKPVWRIYPSIGGAVGTPPQGSTSWN